jgi:hypothetical protein
MGINMKIEIDLNDILGDEYGSETLNESIKRQVIENLTTKLNSNILSKVNEEVNTQVSEAVRTAVAERMQDIVDNVLEAKYIPVSSYGKKEPETCFRDSLVNEIKNQMTYKHATYASDKNVFTRSVDDIVATQMKLISKNFQDQCNTDIAKQAFTEAVNLLKIKLGIG